MYWYCKEKLDVDQSLLGLKGLSNDDGDVNENGKKAIGLDWQNNNFARASRFFVHFLAVVARLQLYNVKVPNFMFCPGREHKTTIFLFFSWTLIPSFRIQLQRNLPTFDWLNKME